MKDNQGSGDGPLYHTPPVRHLLHSPRVAQTFQIDIALPIRRRGEARRFPVVYVTDGNANFDALKGISWSLQKTGSDAPDFILVGIGYPGDSPRAGRFLRRRDFTFDGYPELDILTRQQPQAGEIALPPGGPDLSGAEAFLDFIEHELVPFVEAEFPVTEDRTLFGHSGGAMLGLYALLTRETLFDRYILSSPCIAYHGPDANGEQIEADFFAPYIDAWLASPTESINRVYLSVGSLEEDEAQPWHLVSMLAVLADRLKDAGRPGLGIVHEVIGDETHMTVWPTAFIRGVKAVFQKLKDIVA